MRQFTICLALLALAFTSTKANDTLHVKHYNISIDTINYTAKSIKGHTQLTVQAKINGTTQIRLSLLKLQVDSVKAGNQKLVFSYNNTNLLITPISPLNSADSLVFTVYYQGKPTADPTFGGFTFSGVYAFNIGVGFDADPHNLGKSWFPCVDDFTDKATYEFHITTAPTYKAFCNGLLQSVTQNANNTKTWHWTLKETIPTYLAAVAVAPFYTMKKNYKGIPVEWGILAGDSSATKKTFAKFDTAMSAFVKAFGPYPWEKVGFIMVPFNGGAMEHASSIHVGKAFIDGTLNYETLWPHELSHMWWGDKVTCETAGDMWLNEGFASFNEYLFTEAAYGKQKYKDLIRTEHRSVVQFAHIKDGSYLSLVNVPHAYTYGTTVYKKGAGVVHTLRNFMGDNSFYKGCKDYLDTYAYRSANSNDLSNALTQSSGINTSRFFQDWVFTQGFPHFSIDSTKTEKKANLFEVTIYTRQRQKGNTHIYQMPVECQLTNGIMDTTVILPIDNNNNLFKVLLPFNPLWIALDRAEKMADATADYEKVITAAGNASFLETNASVNVTNAGTASSTVRIEHDFVRPDGFKVNKGIRVSDYHYWTVDGLFSQGFLAKATFNYDGSKNTTTGYLDNTFIYDNEDSLVFLYRANAGKDWEIVKGITHNKGNTNNKWGSFTIDTLKKGEYTLGMNSKYVLSTGSIVIDKETFVQAFPNPVFKGDICTIDFKMGNANDGMLTVLDIQGKEVWHSQVFSHQEFVTWDTFGMASGTYVLQLSIGGKPIKTSKIEVCR